MGIIDKFVNKITKSVLNKIEENSIQTEIGLFEDEVENDEYLLAEEDILFDVIIRNQDETSDYVMSFLDKLKVSFNKDEYGNIFYLDHKDKPFLSAHMDTVRDSFDKRISSGIVDTGSNIIYTGTVIGGDDKCGVAIILRLLSEGKKINFIFSRDEETGLKGAHAIGNDRELSSKIKDNCLYGLILDRKGNSDILCTQNNYGTKEFEVALEKCSKDNGFIYSSARGTLCDADVYNEFISCANLSVGYYNQHTDREFIDINEFKIAKLFVEAVIDGVTDRFIAPEAISYGYPSYCGYNGYYGYGGYTGNIYNYPKSNKKNSYSTKEAITVIYQEGSSNIDYIPLELHFFSVEKKLFDEIIRSRYIISDSGLDNLYKAYKEIDIYSTSFCLSEGFLIRLEDYSKDKKKKYLNFFLEGFKEEDFVDKEDFVDYKSFTTNKQRRDEFYANITGYYDEKLFDEDFGVGIKPFNYTPSKMVNVTPSEEIIFPIEILETSWNYEEFKELLDLEDVVVCYSEEDYMDAFEQYLNQQKEYLQNMLDENIEMYDKEEVAESIISSSLEEDYYVIDEDDFYYEDEYYSIGDFEEIISANNSDGGIAYDEVDLLLETSNIKNGVCSECMSDYSSSLNPEGFEMPDGTWICRECMTDLYISSLSTY